MDFRALRLDCIRIASENLRIVAHLNPHERGQALRDADVTAYAQKLYEHVLEEAPKVAA